MRYIWTKLCENKELLVFLFLLVGLPIIAVTLVVFAIIQANTTLAFIAIPIAIFWILIAGLLDWIAMLVESYREFK